MLQRTLFVVAFACMALVMSPRAQAVTFEFDTLPDSAGCSQPVATGDLAAAYTYCDTGWVADLEGGIVGSHEQTIDGLTLVLTTQDAPGNGVDWDTGALAPGGAIFCGNTPDCTPYVVTFSQVLSFLSVDLLGVENRCGCGDDGPAATAYYLELYDGPDATGALLGQLVLDPLTHPAPVTLALAATGIRSALFGASTLDSGECPGGCANLAVADHLVAVVPEPATASLLAVGLAGLALRARRRKV